MAYDYIIKGGTMIDFEKNCTYIDHLYIRGGYIVEPGSGREEAGTQVIDATGKFVVPGLIDEHAHWNYEVGSLGVNADMVCPCSGVTTTVDAGSTGVENFEIFYRSDIMRYETDVLAYLHISRHGVVVAPTHEENQNPNDIDEKKIFQLFAKYPNCLKGLKVRVSQHTQQYGYGLEPLRSAVSLADRLNQAGYECLVAVHVANFLPETKISDILDLLRPGDVYTHPFQNLGPTIFNPDGTVLDCVKNARKRGVLFSSGNGSIHWCLDNLKKAYDDGFFPDFISSDIVRHNMYLRPGFNLPYSMCTSLLSGMSVIDVFRAVTVNPAKRLGLLGTVGKLEPGYKADVAIFDLAEAKTRFCDRFGNQADAEKVFVPLLTMKNGKVLFRQIYFDGGCDYGKVEKNFV